MDNVKRIRWGDKRSWPYGGEAYTFIAEALDIVGRQVHGMEWAGDEYWYGYMENLLGCPTGKLEDAGRYARRDAMSLLQHFRPDLAPKAADLLTDEVWETAHTLHPPYLERWDTARLRVEKAKETLRELCSQGKLVATYRWEHSGDHTEIEASKWNTDKFRTWLQHGEVRYSDVGSSYGGSRSHETHYLFIERGGLDKLVGPPTITVAAGEPPFHQSEYLKFLMAAAARLDVGPDDPRLAKTIQNEIIALAKEIGRDDLITANIAKSMATILRSPEAGGGKNSKTWGQRQPRK